MPHLNFTRNWNNKLSCGQFTTIRRHRSDLHEGMDLDIMLDGRRLYLANIPRITTQPFRNIPQITVMTDTGYDYTDSLEIFRRFFRCPDKESLLNTETDVILLKRIT
jgi:hypothetical protein